MDWIFFCPQCKGTFGLSGSAEKICSTCHCELIFSGNSDQTWYSFPRNTREEKKFHIITEGTALTNRIHRFETTDEILFKTAESDTNFVRYDAKNKLVNINGLYFPSNKVLGFDLNEDGIQITSGGLGAAITGGLVGSVAPKLIGRSTGAIVGASVGKRKTTNVCTTMDVYIFLQEPYSGVVSFPLIVSNVSRNSAQYIEAKVNGQKVIDFFNKITASEEKEEKPSAQPIQSVAEEIKKFKELLDLGIITQEEFDAKKKQLLGL